MENHNHHKKHQFFNNMSPKWSLFLYPQMMIKACIIRVQDTLRMRYPCLMWPRNSNREVKNKNLLQK